jgi:uncharacterized membrane protein
MTQASANRAVMVILAYLWPLALIPFLFSRDDRDVRWHAKNGLVLMAGEFVILLAASIAVLLASMAALGLGFGLGLITLLLWVAVLMVHLLAMVKALNGSRLVVPVLSKFADRF